MTSSKAQLIKTKGKEILSYCDIQKTRRVKNRIAYPGKTPKTPPSAQDGTSPGGGGVGNISR